jgi:diguanylate cyclase (GGDEF)-like protein
LDDVLLPARAAADDQRMTWLRRRLLPGAPVWLLAGLVLVAVGLIAAQLVPGVPMGARAALAGSLVLKTLLAFVLHWRLRRVGHEREVWGRIAIATLITAGALLTSLVLTLCGVSSAVASVPAACGPLLSFPFVYGGLIRWNRYSTSLADPHDVLNGASAVLVGIAIGNTVVNQLGGGLDLLPTWELQPFLAWTAALLVISGTAASMLGLGGMHRDPRVWLLVVGHVGLLGVAIAMTLAGEVLHGWAAALGAVNTVFLALAVTLRPTPALPQAADPTASTVGAFVVMFAATSILVTDAVSGSGGVATWCAAAAALGASIRLLINVRELAQLAVSRREALTDELTDAANRRAVLRRIEQLARDGEPVVLALLDLDKFKEVNDGLGHSAGDDLLRLVAERLTLVVGPTDVLGRLGGDEFAVVSRLPADAAPAEWAAEVGHRLCAQLTDPFLVGGLTLHVRASVGVSYRSVVGAPDGDDGSAARALMLRQADAAMYDAKRSGAEVTVYDATRHADSSGHLALVEEMRRGLLAGEFVLHHQPQVEIASGRAVGVEALVRWAHPTRGLLGPADFLPLAEVHGLMGALTDTVLCQAVAQAAAWRRAGHDLRVSVNLSASNLLDTALPQRVAGLLAAHDVPPAAIVLEVTESVLLSDPERSLGVVADLAALGTTVSIDDFGTGYASLTYLRQLPVAELKLDRSFTADLLTDARAAAIVASTIGLAHQLGLRVVAEGVEDDATLCDLRQLGCDESQGYLHSPPLPAAELAVWLAGRTARPAPALRR